MTRSAPLAVLCCLLALAACSDKSTGASDGGLPDAAALKEASVGEAGPETAPDQGPPACGSAFGSLPAGAETITWDDGTGATHARKQTWSITDSNTGKKHEIAKEVLHEAVRFDVDHPAKVVGFSVQWGNLPAGAAPTTLLKAGLYRDFGTNGFDFWAKKPLWEGTRCVRDHKDGAWLTYVLDKPIELKQPGLIYVAHKAEKTTDPVFLFDKSASPENKCDKWDYCHSSLNLPTVLSYYNGLTFTIPYDFMVRLHVVYDKKIAAKDKIFQKVSGGPSGKHVSWGDYNHDGWDDALVAGKLYKNDKGKLSDVSSAARVPSGHTGGVFGDYDNDGCLDLFLFAESTTKADTLLKSNCDGTFKDVTAAAGIVDKQSYNDCGGDAKNIRSPTAAAAWVDLDSDGNLDLYLANFICWSQENYYIDTVFRNKGDGTFEEWSEKHGFVSSRTPSRTVAPADFDRDGDEDIFVGNYRLIGNLFFQNAGGSFSDVAKQNSAVGSPYTVGGRTYYGHTIGAQWGDLDNDGDLDLVVGNLAHPRFFTFSNKTQLLLNQGDGTFKDAAGSWKDSIDSPAGLVYRETHSVPLLADVDQDGNLDLAVTQVYDGRPTDFYWGKGQATFELDIYSTGITTENGWGAAASDYDNDGDPDLHVTDLFQNTLATAKKGHWLQVRALGTKQKGGNWAGIGTIVTVKAGGKTYVRLTEGAGGKGGQSSQYLHFGLGSATSVDSIEVTYPGKTTRVTVKGPLSADQRVWINADGTHTTGWSPK